LIAVMLGRLKMSISDCLEHYRALSDQAFSKKNLLKRAWDGELSPLDAHYDTTKLEEAIKSVVNDLGSPQLLREEDENPSCKMSVILRLAQNPQATNKAIDSLCLISRT
jgi:calcium-independent phospholipase A2-gamma